jgi:hypothetical protein
METLDCTTLKQTVAKFSLVRSCDVVSDGAFRIATPFIYPNGSRIDVFLKPTNDLYKSYILSDYGQTSQYLYEMGFNLTATKKRRQIIDDICKGLGVKYKSGFFELDFGAVDLDSLSDYIVHLSQACIRVADLSFTQRLQSYATFESEVEEFIALTELEYDTEPIDLIGIHDNPVKVDFRVKGHKVSSLIQTWSTRNISVSHITSTDIFAKWYDLQNYRSVYQFITVYDDTHSSFRAEDLARLDDYSTVFGFPQQREQFREAINA